MSDINTGIYESALLKGSFDNEGIFVADTTSAERSLENYQLLFDLYKKASQNGTRKICMLCNVSKSSSMNKEARELIATELPKYIKAIALISDSAVGKLIGNIFVVLTPQKFPTRIFTNKEEAKDWLKQHL